jgi:hypothetical protein
VIQNGLGLCACSGALADENRQALKVHSPFTERDLILRLAVDFWIPAFAGMTPGTAASVRHAGESRHPELFPQTQDLNRWCISR